jgi:hypothetical protein
MHRMTCRQLAAAVACAELLATSNAEAFRMIQNSGVGRTSFGNAVPCDNAVGFAHWTTPSVAWALNPANQGGNAGVVAALQNAMAAWNQVTPASYTLVYTGTANRGFATDGVNTVVWAVGNGCTGGCLAITALVLQAGQVITETDISFNDAATFNTDGRDYDVQAIATHEFGHTLGIHHTDVKRKSDRPTMYASYFGVTARTLASDDQAALNCSFSRYPLAGGNLVAGVGAGSDTGNKTVATLTARPQPHGANLRFPLMHEDRVRLDLFDVAGRHVATLVDGDLGPGEHEVAWDGATSRGPVATGVYFARLATREGRASTTVVFAK